MHRWKLTIEYNGKHFNGWQSQKDSSGVQDTIQAAIYEFSGEKITIYGAGRTDSGVHAIGQVAHFDITRNTNKDEIREALNNYLRPKLVSIIKVDEVTENFHARFSAKKRHYIYKLINRRQPLTIDKGLYWRVGSQLNIEEMQIAAKHLIGTHDFTTFRSVNCQSNTPIKSLDNVEIKNKKEKIFFSFSAKSFLHNQIRSIVGSLKLVGEGKWSSNKISEILNKKERSECGPLAPPEGLYFESVDY